MVSHVIFVIHGMGHQLEGYGKFEQNLGDLRKSCQEVLTEEFSTSEDVEFVPIEWHSKLHQLESVDRRIQSVTLPTCSVLRGVCNDILADVLYYFTCFHGETILAIVTDLLNKEYDAFLQRTPGFSGRVGIFAHSLGGVIAYDIISNQHQYEDESLPLQPSASQGSRSPGSGSPLSGQQPTASSRRLSKTHYDIKYPRLRFRPNFLFAIGSPVAAVLIMRGQSFHDYRPPKWCQYQNIFNLYDPLAYRIEPLVSPSYASISPVLLRRPSASAQNQRSYYLQYYRELLSTYFTGLFNMPTMPTMPAMPTMPNLAQLPPFPPIPNLSDLPQFSQMFPQVLPFATFAEFKKMFFGAPGISDNTNANTNGKRRRIADGDQPHGDSLEFESEINVSHPAHGSSGAHEKTPGFMRSVGPEAPPPRKLRRLAQDQALSTDPTPSLSAKGDGIPPAADLPGLSLPGNDTAGLDDPSTSASLVDTLAGMLQTNFLSRLYSPLTDEASAAPDSDDATTGESNNIFKSESSQGPESTDRPKAGKRKRAKSTNIPDQQQRAEKAAEAAMAAYSAELDAAAEEMERAANKLTQPRLSQHPSRSRVWAASETNTETSSSTSEGYPDDDNAPTQPHIEERIDYFVQETIIDNVIHQYFLGLKAHFSYWSNRDIMFHIIREMLGHSFPSEDRLPSPSLRSRL